MHLCCEACQQWAITNDIDPLILRWLMMGCRHTALGSLVTSQLAKCALRQSISINDHHVSYPSTCVRRKVRPKSDKA
jgi:hypothetical protein